MHLVAATAGVIADGSEPVDPNQTPAEIVFLSAADSEIGALSAANALSASDPNFLRVGQLGWLTHPYATDLYIDKTAADSRLVIIRALGGLAYWQYVIGQFSERLRDRGQIFVALPGDDRSDRDLMELSTVSADAWYALHGYCVEGGIGNYCKLLDYCKYLLRRSDMPAAPVPFLRAGYYWPGMPDATADILESHWQQDQPVTAIIFYRALLQSGDLDAVDALIRCMAKKGHNPLPLFITSTKDPVSIATIDRIFERSPPDIVLNSTNFAAGAPGLASGSRTPTMLDKPGRPVLQAILATSDRNSWKKSDFGLGPRDIAMSVSLPEVDGRIISRAFAFKSRLRRDEAAQCDIARYAPDQERTEFVASLAHAWSVLATCPAGERKIAILLANYPNRDGRLANGVGLDTPASVADMLQRLSENGYYLPGAPTDSSELMDALLAGPTNEFAGRSRCIGGELLDLNQYHGQFMELPSAVRQEINSRWGHPENDPFIHEGHFRLAIQTYGHVAIGIQPARGYNIDPSETYHDPSLVPPHNYVAFYFWLRQVFGAHAIIHFGKHGNLEWLPGKSLALSKECYSDAILGPTPHIYPFIVNDPGEGTQAKRRCHAVIVDHLTPPLTRAGSFGQLRELEQLLDEYHQALTLDAKRALHLEKKILRLSGSSGLDVDAGLEPGDDPDGSLRKIDSYLCDLKESQIRDGLHIFGQSPTGERERDLLCALARLPRADGRGGNASLIRSLARDLDLPTNFDPLSCDGSEAWSGPRPPLLESRIPDLWRSAGDTVERLELLAADIVQGNCQPPGRKSAAVAAVIENRIRPSVQACGEAETNNLLTALDGGFVPPGPSGAPSRGRPDLLPTGCNFYSVDSRSLPTRTAWELGWHSASLIVERYVQMHGDWPRQIAVTAWGTANMRTGGDDIAQILALIGARPRWSEESDRVEGFEILPASTLGRPRVDATLRISGFFRDAFPTQIDLIASATRAVMELDEDEEINPAAAAFRREAKLHGEDGAGFRVFGSRPGAYGAGLQAMLDERLWTDRQDLADTYLEWGGYAYGGGANGCGADKMFRHRLTNIQIVVQNQDNREHDLLDSDDYYQFEGGLSATVESLSGRKPTLYHMDHSRPERPVVRTLEEEIGRVVRSRATNPKWIAGVKRHGYKGAFEIAATVQYLFAFAATTGAVRQHHFDLVHEAYFVDADTVEFMRKFNPAALSEAAGTLLEAIDRGLWHPRSNSARSALATLAASGANDIGEESN